MSKTTKTKATMRRTPKGARASRTPIARDPSIVPARRPTTPGEVLIHEWLLPQATSQSAFAIKVGVSRDHLDAILCGARRVTKRTARLLSRALGTSWEFWMNLQAAVDRYDARNPPEPQDPSALLAIYTVSVVSVRDGQLSQCRPMCWRPTREAAEDDIRMGACLLFEEGSYQYAVIEKVPAGLAVYTGWKASWFAAEHKGDDVYVISELANPPDFAKNVVNFGLG